MCGYGGKTSWKHKGTLDQGYLITTAVICERILVMLTKNIVPSTTHAESQQNIFSVGHQNVAICFQTQH